MFFDWFNTKEAALVGINLADNLSTDLVKTNNKNPKKEIEHRAKIMQNIFVQLDQYTKKNSLNFYKKSKLVNEFKWRLLEIGHSKDFVDTVSKELLLHMN